MNSTTKTFSAILGMALCMILSVMQFTRLLGAERTTGWSSAVLLTMTVLSGLVTLATAMLTVRLVASKARG